MAKVTRKALEKLLTDRLELENPSFELEQLPGGRISGSVISDSFEGMKDSDRQRRIWDALEAEFGSDSTSVVGTLLAYTDPEWKLDLKEC